MEKLKQSDDPSLTYFSAKVVLPLAGSPSAISGCRIHLAFSRQDDTILTFCLGWFNQAVAYIPCHQRWVAREGITIPTTAGHFDNQPIASWDNL
jgi:hypothetical protein